MNLHKLPEPDDRGNYWFGKPGQGAAPAIFPVRGKDAQLGKFFLSLGRDGLVFAGMDFQLFETAKDALKELRRRLGQ